MDIGGFRCCPGFPVFAIRRCFQKCSGYHLFVPLRIFHKGRSLLVGPVLPGIHSLSHCGPFYQEVLPERQGQALDLPCFEHRVSFFLLFSGFVLKGDKEGIFAGFMVYNLTGQVPLFGEKLQKLLLHPGKDFFVLPYLYHILLVPALFLALLNRVHSWKPGLEDVMKSLFLIIPVALLLPIPVDINPSIAVNHVRGPWFSWGIQQLLMHLPPFVVGIIFPGIFIAVFSVLPFLPEKFEKIARAFIYLTVCFYIGLCVIFRLTW